MKTEKKLHVLGFYDGKVSLDGSELKGVRSYEIKNNENSYGKLARLKLELIVRV